MNRHKLIKLISTLLIITFTSQQLVWAYPGCAPVVHNGLRPVAAGEREKRYEHPLGPNPQVEHTLEGLKAVLNQMIEWLKAKRTEEYPNVGLLGRLQSALIYADWHPTRVIGVLLLKNAAELDRRTGLPQVFIGRPSLYNVLQERLSSVHDFVVLTATLPREAKGLEVAYAIHTEVKKRIADINRVIGPGVLNIFESEITQILLKQPGMSKGPAAIYFLKNLNQDRYKRLSEFLTANRSQIRDFMADLMAGECIEAAEEVKALHWAARNGLFDFTQARFIGNNERQLFQSDGQVDSILPIELRQLGMTHLIHWLRGGAVRNEGPVVMIFYMFSEINAFLTSDGREGFDPANLDIVFEGDRVDLDKLSLEAFSASTSTLLEPVRDRVMELERKIARMKPVMTAAVGTQAPSERLLEGREELLRQINEAGSRIESLDTDGLDDLLVRVFPKIPFISLDKRDIIMIQPSLVIYGYSFLVRVQIDILLDYYLNMQKAESEAGRLAHESI